MFDPQDHFKGNYHKDKKVEPEEINFHLLPSGFNEIGEAGDVYHTTYGWIDKSLADSLDYINKLPITYPPGYELVKKSIDICEHDPVDVGFSKPKLVCKKCDKDLC